MEKNGVMKIKCKGKKSQYNKSESTIRSLNNFCLRFKDLSKSIFTIFVDTFILSKRIS